jgi:hypothetical protein
LLVSTHVADDPRTGSAEPPLQTSVFETDAQLKKHLDRTPASIRQLVVRFGIGAVAALTLVSMFTAFTSRSIGEKQAIKEAKEITLIIAKGVIETNADDALLHGDPAAIERLDKAVTSGVLNGSLVRVKLWTQDGTIIYSAHRAEICPRRGQSPDVREQAHRARGRRQRPLGAGEHL